MTKALPAWTHDMVPVDMDAAAMLLGVSRRFLVDVIREHPHYEPRGTKKVFYPEHIAQLRLIVEKPCLDPGLETALHIFLEQLPSSAEADLRSFLSRNVQGTVYLIRSGDRVKIGFASNLRQRMRVLRTACPYPVEVIATIPGDRDLEAFLHNCFRSLRRHGEWFEETGDLLKLTRALDAHNIGGDNTVENGD